jgi:4-amino-4-deoxy-L-arabinose transferase-like glycosyltransferase
VATDRANQDYRWLLALAAVLASIVFVYPLLLDIPLLDPDEGLLASVSREMAESGDWLTPRVQGKPFLDKPVFYFWVEALSIRAFGANETAVRLPGLLFGLLGAATTAAIGWRMLGRTTGVLAGLFYTTMILPCALAQAAANDVVLVPCVNLVLLFLWETANHKRQPNININSQNIPHRTRPDYISLPTAHCPLPTSPRPLPTPHSPLSTPHSPLLLGILLSLTILTKGLVAIALVSVVFGSYLIARWWLNAGEVEGDSPIFAANSGYSKKQVLATAKIGTVPHTLLQFIIAASVIAVAIAAPWYVAMEAVNPGYLRYFFFERHLLGFTTATQPHGAEAWWYYLPVLFGGGLPWIGYLPINLIGAKRRLSVKFYYARHKMKRLAAAGTAVHPRFRPTFRRPLNSLVSFLRGITIRSTDSPMLLLWCWLLGGTGFFMLAGSKLVTYLWPVFPAVAILAAVPWARLIEGKLSQTAERLLSLTFRASSAAAPLVLAIVLAVVQRQLDLRFSALAWTVVVSTGFLAWIPLLFWLTGRMRAAIGASVLSTAMQFLVIMTCLVPQAGRVSSARELAQYFNRLGRLPRQLFVVEARPNSFYFYLDPRLRGQLREDQVLSLKLARMAEAEDDMNDGDLIALPEAKAAKAFRYVDLEDASFDTAGGYRLYSALDFHRRSQRSNNPDTQADLKQTVATR